MYVSLFVFNLCIKDIIYSTVSTMETSPPLLWLHSGLNVPLTPVKRPVCNKESVITRAPLAVFVLTITWFSCHYQQETRATFTRFPRWEVHIYSDRRNYIKPFKQAFACKAISSILQLAKQPLSSVLYVTLFLCSSFYVLLHLFYSESYKFKAFRSSTARESNTSI